MAKWNKLALNVVMVTFGVLMIVGSLLATVGTTLFPFDQLVGTRAAVAGVAFGAGLALAGMQPVVPATWVRAALFYCVLDVLYEIVNAIWLGTNGFSLIALLVSLILGGLLIFLSPNRSELMPRSTTPAAAARI
jgi:predicted phage tail protein